MSKLPPVRTWGNTLDGTYALINKIMNMDLENRLELILLCNHEDSSVSQAAKNRLSFFTETMKGVSGASVIEKWEKVSIKFTPDNIDTDLGTHFKNAPGWD